MNSKSYLKGWNQKFALLEDQEIAKAKEAEERKKKMKDDLEKQIITNKEKVKKLQEAEEREIEQTKVTWKKD